MGKCVGIVSLKGGVGKTSVVTALGAALADFDKKILLVDGNLSAPNLGIHLDIIGPDVTLHHVLNDLANPLDAVYTYGNFDVLPSSVVYKGGVSPLKLKDKIKPLKKSYDIILLDSSPSLNEETLAVILASDEVFVVTTPDYPTLSMTLRAINLAKKRGTLINGLILNKVHNKDFELSLKDIEEVTEVPVLAVIPYEINVLKALSEFVPSTIYTPKSKGSTEYRKLAAGLIGEKYKPSKLKNFLRWVSPKRPEINREIFYKRSPQE